MVAHPPMLQATPAAWLQGAELLDVKATIAEVEAEVCTDPLLALQLSRGQHCSYIYQN